MSNTNTGKKSESDVTSQSYNKTQFKTKINMDF